MPTFAPGDRVEANYCLEGTYYPGKVVQVDGDEPDGGGQQAMITVEYDDDGSSESLPSEHVRLLIPPTATQTTLGGPLSDEDAFGSNEDGDDKFLVPIFELQAELAQLKGEFGDVASASALYEQAADGAMSEGKMKTATQWSLKASELLQRANE